MIRGPHKGTDGQYSCGNEDLKGVSAIVQKAIGQKRAGKQAYMSGHWTNQRDLIYGLEFYDGRNIVGNILQERNRLL